MKQLGDIYHYPDGYLDQAQAVLDQAMSEVPFYRDHWARYDRGPQAGIWDRYAGLPELTKADMRAHFPDGFCDARLDRRRALAADDIEYTFTSGTTGDKVINLWNQKWWRGGERASWKMNPATAHVAYPAPRMAELTSALNLGIHCEEDLPMDHRIMGNVLHLNEKLNIIAWQNRHYQRMAQELQDFRPAVLEANPSLLARLAYWSIDNGVKLYSPRAIILTYELASAIHVKAIHQAFSCPTVSSYGTTETGFVMMEGADGRMYQNTGWCHIDFLPLKGSRTRGRILVTNFNNPWSVIIRFSTGDLVTLAKPDPTDDGHDGLIAAAIDGRLASCTYAVDGTLVSPRQLDEALAAIDGIREYAMSQPAYGVYHLKLAGPDHSASLHQMAIAALRHLYGQGGAYDVTFVEDLWPGPAGKYSRVRCAITMDEKEMFVNE